MFKIMGITDTVTICDCCGKKNLKVTVELENDEGEMVHYGRDCAGAAVYGRKNAANGKAAEFRARVVERCKTVLPIVMDMINGGHNAEQIKRRLGGSYSVSFGVYSDTGNKMPLRIYALDCSIPGVELQPNEY